MQDERCTMRVRLQRYPNSAPPLCTDGLHLWEGEAVDRAAILEGLWLSGAVDCVAIRSRQEFCSSRSRTSLLKRPSTDWARESLTRVWNAIFDSSSTIEALESAFRLSSSGQLESLKFNGTMEGLSVLLSTTDVLHLNLGGLAMRLGPRSNTFFGHSLEAHRSALRTLHI